MVSSWWRGSFVVASSLVARLPGGEVTIINSGEMKTYKINFYMAGKMNLT